MAVPTVPASLCVDTSEAIELYAPYGLYLKPFSRIHVSVQLPQLKTPGKSISNWEVMEKVKGMIRPDVFTSLKIVKSTLEFIRFEGELENKTLIPALLNRLDTKTIKLSGFPDILKVRAAEAKVVFPSRHDWESHFRDAKGLNEMKPGERPDTLYLQGLPIKWFISQTEPLKSDKPNEYVLLKAFSCFGAIRCVDIPTIDPYRAQIAQSGAIQTFSFGQGLHFDAFVQFKEYIGFVKAMDCLRGMKLLYKAPDEKAWTAVIKVEYDKTCHLSDKLIRRRRLEREKLKKAEREREEAKKAEREREERRVSAEKAREAAEEQEKESKKQEKLERRRHRQAEREEKRRLKREQKKREEEEAKMQKKIAKEERKILIAQRKLESIRLLSELIAKVKGEEEAAEVTRREQELEEEQRRRAEAERRHRIGKMKRQIEREKRKKAVLSFKEHELRGKIMRNMRDHEEKKAEDEREQLRRKLSGTARLKSAVVLQRGDDKVEKGARREISVYGGRGGSCSAREDS